MEAGILYGVYGIKDTTDNLTGVTAGGAKI
jgi:hypothetical protein